MGPGSRGGWGDARRRSRAASCWLFKGQAACIARRTTMRVNAGFSRRLRLEGIWVRGVQFNANRVVVWVALRRRRLRCPLCSYSTPHRHNRQQVQSTWRHLDLGVWRLELRAQLRRLDCPEHGFGSRACRSRGTPAGSPAISRRWSRGWRRRPTRARSDGWSGSTGTPSGGSSVVSAPTSLIPTGCTTCLRSAWTRSAGDANIAISRSSPTTSAARSFAAPKITARRRRTGSATSSASLARTRSR